MIPDLWDQGHIVLGGKKKSHAFHWKSAPSSSLLLDLVCGDGAIHSVLAGLRQTRFQCIKTNGCCRYLLSDNPNAYCLERLPPPDFLRMESPDSSGVAF